MSTETRKAAEVNKGLAEAIERLMGGVRDPEVTRKAFERMDRMREEVRRRNGILNIAVPAVREIRD
jgi:hypothetical protein